jgi:hypothetical protein
VGYHFFDRGGAVAGGDESAFAEGFAGSEDRACVRGEGGVDEAMRLLV